jgi:hypothetical protein
MPNQEIKTGHTFAFRMPFPDLHKAWPEVSTKVIPIINTTLINDIIGQDVARTLVVNGIIRGAHDGGKREETVYEPNALIRSVWAVYFKNSGKFSNWIDARRSLVAIPGVSSWKKLLATDFWNGVWGRAMGKGYDLTDYIPEDIIKKFADDPDMQENSYLLWIKQKQLKSMQTPE